MKELIDIGVYKYPPTEEGLQEAIKDAQDAANAQAKRDGTPVLATMYVLHNQAGYYGPVNAIKRRSIGYRHQETAQKIEPEENTHVMD
jgi:hypothetical protein